MNRQIFFVPGINPEPWAVGSLGVRNTGKKPVPFIGPNPQLVTYKQAVTSEVQNHLQVILVDEPCSVKFLFWRRLDKYATLSDKGHQRHIADVTNLQKATEDALQGVAITNDRLVQRVTSMIVEQSVETNPGILIVMKWPFSPHDELEIQQDVLDKFAAMRQKCATDYLDLGNNY